MFSPAQLNFLSRNELWIKSAWVYNHSFEQSTRRLLPDPCRVIRIFISVFNTRSNALHDAPHTSLQTTQPARGVRELPGPCNGNSGPLPGDSTEKHRKLAQKHAVIDFRSISQLFRNRAGVFHEGIRKERRAILEKVICEPGALIDKTPSAIVSFFSH